jgi:hypothetical protein
VRLITKDTSASGKTRAINHDADFLSAASRNMMPRWLFCLTVSVTTITDGKSRILEPKVKWAAATCLN